MPKPKGHSISPAVLERARDFRHPLTPPEAKLWHAVRNRQLGFKLRRQHPIGRFIVGRSLADFYCAEARLAIEIDGDTHSAPYQVAYDAVRTGVAQGARLPSDPVPGRGGREQPRGRAGGDPARMRGEDDGKGLLDLIHPVRGVYPFSRYHRTDLRSASRAGV
ncbi:MAG TPA: endonuclease domain-containing protein [Anaerolineales bacterium]|nr:endonuclease domain-containing protein [Anaerolineales bacterium]